MPDGRDSNTEDDADERSTDGSGYRLSASDLEHLVYLDDDTDMNDATQLMEPQPSEERERAARGLKFIHNVQATDPHCVDDLAAASISDWLHVEGDMPTRIGRHEIRRRLGSGGFGVVFLAFDPELEREVALKVPRVETLINGQTRRRFLRESKTAARLNHPNIATIFEAGTVGPIFYIASEYCPGGSLDDYLKCETSPSQDSSRSGRLPPLAAAHLIASLAEAIDHAHQRGILHRDIKPSNVLLDLDPAERERLKTEAATWGSAAKLVDFGLAKHMNVGDEGTKSGVMLGTPAYAAPEMVIDRENAGVTADIYSLGATLFHALTGQAPLKKATDFETLLAAQREEVKAPSRYEPSVPPDLDAICLKCLEKSPRDRYSSAADLAQDLRAFILGHPIHARRATAVERTTRWCRRNATLATMIALATILLFVSGGAMLYALQIARNQAAYSARLEIMREEVNMRRLFDQARKEFAIRQPEVAPGEGDIVRKTAYQWTPNHDWMVASTHPTLEVWDHLKHRRLAVMDFDQSPWAVSDGLLVVRRQSVGADGPPIRSFSLPNLDPLDDTVEQRNPSDVVSMTHQQLATSTDYCVLSPNETTLLIMPLNGQPATRELTLAEPISRISLCSATSQLAVALTRGVDVYDVKSGERLATVSSIQARDIAFSPSGNDLVIVSNSHVTRIRTSDWKIAFVASLDVGWAVESGQNDSSRIAFAEQNRLLAVRAAGQMIHLFRMDSGELVTKVEIPDSDTLAGVGFSTDENLLIAGTEEGTVYQWDLPWLDEHLLPLMNDWQPISGHREYAHEK